MRIPASSPLLALVVVVAGCSAGGEGSTSSDARVERASAAIIHGEDSTSAQDAVVEIAMRPGGSLVGLCSATLVAPNLVLTARHCVAQTDTSATCTTEGLGISGGVVYTDYAPGDLYVYRGAGATQDLRDDQDGTPSRFAARGRAVIVEGNTLCNADLAFLVLDVALSGATATIRTAAPVAGETFTAVGYGLDETGKLPALRQQRSDVTVFAVGKLGFGGSAGLGDAELIVGESACSGDSGGPLLSPVDGTVAAVVSRGGGGDGPDDNPAGHCTGSGAHMIYTHLATKADLLARAFGEAGLTPPPPPPPAASDAGAPVDAAASRADGGDAGAGSRDAAPSSPASPGSDVPDADAESGSTGTKTSSGGGGTTGTTGSPSSSSCAMGAARHGTSRDGAAFIVLLAVATAFAQRRLRRAASAAGPAARPSRSDRAAERRP